MGIKTRRGRKEARCEAWEDIFVDGKRAHGHGHSSTALIGGDAGHWAEFAKHLAQVLDTVPGVRVYVNAGSTKIDSGAADGFRN